MELLSIQTCTLGGHLHRVTYARYRINIIDSPDDEHSVCNSIDEEIKERIILGTKAYYANLKFFESRLVTKQSKLKLYRTVIRPIVTYASETWV